MYLLHLYSSSQVDGWYVKSFLIDYWITRLRILKKQVNRYRRAGAGNPPCFGLPPEMESGSS